MRPIVEKMEEIKFERPAVRRVVRPKANTILSLLRSRSPSLPLSLPITEFDNEFRRYEEVQGVLTLSPMDDDAAFTAEIPQFFIHEVCDAGDEAEDLPLLCGVVKPAESTPAAEKPEKLCLKPVRHSVKLFMKPENFEKPFMKNIKPV